jgi:hypothetical protein
MFGDTVPSNAKKKHTKKRHEPTTRKLMETSASEQELFDTYKAMRAIAVDSLNAAHRSLDFVNKLAPAVCRANLSEFIPLQAGSDISVGLEYKRLRVPTFLNGALALVRGGFNARPCPAGFEIVQARTDVVVCVLNTSKPLFEVSLEAFLLSFANQHKNPDQAQAQVAPLGPNLELKTGARETESKPHSKKPKKQRALFS